jgi:putative CocE/NonD family hydrolase
LAPTSTPARGEADVNTRTSFISHFAIRAFCWLPPETNFSGCRTLGVARFSPAGFAANLADGFVRTRYRESTKRHSPPLTPGEAVLVDVDLWDLAHTFLPGHRLRLEVSSSNFPRFDRNLNTGHELGADGADDALTAAQQIVHDAEHPSALVLPVI